MKELVKQIIKSTPLYPSLYNLRVRQVKRRMEREQLAEWERQGRPAPPPHPVKQRNLRRYGKEYGLRVLVETGTFMGDMVEAMKRDFDRIYSIELGQDLYEKAKQRFADEPHITILQGDSGVVIKQVLAGLDRPALFWLDGHFSAGITAQGERDTPVSEELRHILDAPDLGHVILIDDARNFGTDPEYPSLEELKAFVSSKRRSDITVEDDSIRIVPAGRARAARGR